MNLEAAMGVAARVCKERKREGKGQARAFMEGLPSG